MPNNDHVDTPSGEPIFDVSGLARAEIITPRPEDTCEFFEEMLALEKVAEEGQSAYFRGYNDTYKHSVKVTEGPEPDFGGATFRTTSKPALERRVEAVKETGLDRGWREEEDVGYGRGFQFESPDGHPLELVWEVEKYESEGEKASKLKNQPSKIPNKSAPAERLDHLNLLAQDVEACRDFFMRTLGFRLVEKIELEDGEVNGGIWLTSSSKMHEMAIMKDRMETPGRHHHIGFWYSKNQHIMDLAEKYREADVAIEAGPAKHGISQAYFMYAYEPGGGHRVETYSQGYFVWDPDWDPIIWREGELDKAIAWYGHLPQDFFVYGLPDEAGQQDMGPHGDIYDPVRKQPVEAS